MTGLTLAPPPLLLAPGVGELNVVQVSPPSTTRP